MNRKLALTHTVIVLMAGMIFTAPPARADVVNLSLSAPAFFGAPGETVNFLGTISAPGTNIGDIDLMGLNVTFGSNLGGPPLAYGLANTMPFFNLPEFLGPGDSFTNVLLFTSMIDPAAVPTSGVVNVNLVANDAAGNDVSTTAVADAVVVPEPASLLMLGIGLIGLAGLGRPKRRVS